jgi:hypothetical protein
MNALRATSAMDILAICLPRGSVWSRSGTLKTLAGKHCQTLIQVKFTRAYLAVEGSARRFGTAGELVTAAGASEDQLLSAAAAVEGGSDHPLAQAILRRAANVKAPKSTGFKNLEGKGAQAEIDGKTVFLGNKLLMTENKIDLGEPSAKSEELQGAGRTVVHPAVDGKLVGLIAIADAVRPTAVDAIKALRARSASKSPC